MADFAKAQKRILQRRAAREQAFITRDSELRESRTNHLLRLPPPLRSFALDSLSIWDRIKTPYGTEPAFRVGQVDAELLDESLIGLLKKHVDEGMKLYGAHLKDDWDAEITAILRICFWKMTLWDNGASYGASLQGLKYIDARRAPDGGEAKAASKWQRAMYGLFSIGGKYSWSKWEDRLSSLESRPEESSPLIRRLGRITTLFNSSYNIAAVISFLVFLYNGRYRTLLDRVLRLRLVPASNQTNREVSFEFLNRQLVWHAFTEFLLFLLPLVGISRWRRWIDRAWKRFTTGLARLRNGAYGRDHEEEQPGGELSFLPERTCAICYQDQNPSQGQSEQEIIARSSAGTNTGIIGSAMTDITNPYEAITCGCIYCFVCLARKIESEEGEGWACLRCGDIIKECRPWDGDVINNTLKESNENASIRPPSRRKSVMFDLQDEKVLLDETASPIEAIESETAWQQTGSNLAWSRIEKTDEEDG